MDKTIGLLSKHSPRLYIIFTLTALLCLLSSLCNRVIISFGFGLNIFISKHTEND